MSQLQNLSATFAKFIDGNLGLTVGSTGPTALVIGTAGKGPGESLTIVDTPGDLISVFGREGNLSRGWIETKEGGIGRVVAYRAGATEAKLRTLMTTNSSEVTAGYQILSGQKGADAGADVKLYYDSSSDVLKIYNESNDLVYHYSNGEVVANTYEVSVRGSATAGFKKDILVGGQETVDEGSYKDAIPLKWIPTPNYGSTSSYAAVAYGSGGSTLTTNAAGFTNSFQVGQYIQINPTTEGFSAVKVSAIDNTSTITVVHADGSTVHWSATGSMTVTVGWDASSVYVAGADNDDPCKMRMYEYLDTAYELLDDAQIDVVVPMGVNVDDDNICDGATITVTANTYPTVRGSNDALGKLYKESYNGKTWYFWDTDANGVAELYPTAEELGFYGSRATGWTSAAGTISINDYVNNSYSASGLDVFVESDFHEVNFGYQLANYCYTLTLNDNEASGVIGMKPPTNFDIAGLASWVGNSPVYAADGVTVLTDGTGLLGNKWVAGVKSSSTTGWYGPGFYATDTGWIDGTIEVDRNEQQVDIGAYLDIVPIPLIYNNTFSTTGLGYISSGATAYAGFFPTLPLGTAATNMTMRGKIRLPFKLNKSTKLDPLAGARYTTFNLRENGSVFVEDAPSATRPTSDYNRRSTVQICFAAIDIARKISSRYRGKGSNAVKMAALENDILTQYKAQLIDTEAVIRTAVKAIQTPTQRARGEATLEILLVPSVELRQITIYLALGLQ